MHEQKVVFPITQHVLDHLNEAILITNQRGEIVAGSKVADEIFEISSAVGKPINRLLELTSLEESKQLTWLKHDRYKMIEVTVLPADSQNQYYYVRLQLVSNQMQAVRQQLDNFATAQFSGTLLYDKRSGNIMDCDTNGATMFHYSKQQLIFKPLSELFTSKLPDNFWREQENRKQVMHAHSAVTKEGERFFVDILYFDLSTETGVCLLKDVTEQVINKKRIEYLAYYDELTDLPNRHYFVHILSETIEKLNRKKDILAVYIVDLDYFKEVNDILGYAVGDELIRHSARRLKKFLDVDTFVARMVGDKFIIMQFGLSSKKEVMEFAEHQIQTFEEPVIINGYDIYTTVTIGVSLFPNHGTTAEDLIKHANSAMYESKNNHRNSYKLFEAAISEKFQSTITLESELRQAIKQKQLELHYQPQVDFNTNQIIGMEALLRWKHPEKGYIAPGEFIGIAEKTGLIIEIGEWVMYEACRQNKLWQDQGYQPITISVNLSAIQFHQKDFLQKVKQIIQKTELSPAYLELEITETMAMTNEQTVLHTLWELRKLGIPVSIDDFGTGYSSLKLLSLFPITKLKIDKMFMEQSEENQMIVKSIIHLCHLLKLKVVAEGVETEEQFAFLKAEQCDQLQGYYFSKALPANQAQQLLVKR
ncbi:MULTISPECIES: EAL domain-containing protein [Clostridia]|uniref:sensor domain-containing protein n=1 Tax=Clostridia TaxID=186801 RepID=UPI000EA3EB8A|nr:MULTISPECIES: EAL domain-containing protein [Clostridia]NBJ71392.1 EAL domain-containing protein [Roseburia sp. 1XD42-34]RKI74653.1 EAL domain-containing protein [Clostridium sp. 1xD42-85]